MEENFTQTTDCDNPAILSPVSQFPRSNKRKRSEKRENCGNKRPRPAKWAFLQHNGPILPSPYQQLPKRIKFVYNKTRINLSPKCEEAALFYVKLHKKKDDVFEKNFFNDWRETMTEEERTEITEWKLCDFRHICNYLKDQRKIEGKIQKKKRQKEEAEMFGFCNIDGVRHEIVNYKINNGLYLAHGDHPKRGKIKKKVEPEDVTINCSEDSQIPQPPEGRSWKQVVHNNSALWLAKWSDLELNFEHYIKLKPNSQLHYKEDQKKYDTAKKLGQMITTIRSQYFKNMNSDDLEVRQRSVALYLIDHLGFRTGFDKYEDEADTVGCCSLRVQHLTLQEDLAVFNFLGKSSVRYYNEASIDKTVLQHLQVFQEDKQPEDNLFDCLATSRLNHYLNSLMEGLTAKVFRTYNASYFFEKFLDFFTDSGSSRDEKIRCYNCANAVVAILLNHRATKGDPKDFGVVQIRKQIQDVLVELKETPDSLDYNKIRKLLHRLKGMLKNKSVLLNTSKKNYLDPRITVAWCKKHDVFVDRIYTKTQKKKFKWAIEQNDGNYRFGDDENGNDSTIEGLQR